MINDTKVILRFEDWLRYNRQIGLEGLYVYLIVEAILLAFTTSGPSFPFSYHWLDYYFRFYGSS